MSKTSSKVVATTIEPRGRGTEMSTSEPGATDPMSGTGAEPKKGGEVKVRIPIDDPWHGYFSERLWAEYIGEPNVFELANSPMFADDYCLGDRVHATQEEGGLTVRRVLSRGGRSKIQLLTKDGVTAEDTEAPLQQFRRAGAVVLDLSDRVRGYIVVDIPRGVELATIRRLAEQGRDAGFWVWNEAYAFDKEAEVPTHSTDRAEWVDDLTARSAQHS
jgi:hypothetical protein